MTGFCDLCHIAEVIDPTNGANECDKLIGDIVYLLHSVASHQLGDNIALNPHSTDLSHFFIVL